MKFFLKNASTRTLLLSMYVIVIVSASIPITLVIVSLNEQIDFIKTAEAIDKSGKIAAYMADDKRHLISALGQSINALLETPISPKQSAWLTHTKNTRTGMISAWLFIFFMSLVVVLLLDDRIKNSLSSLNKVVNQLTKNQIDDPITVDGSRNLQGISAGLEKLRRRLLESKEQLSQTLRHISHEIKTPLTSIKEGTYLLDEEFLGPINDQQREITEILKKSTKELQDSIENLLDYNVVTAVQKIKKRVTVDLSELVDLALEKHALTIKTKQLVIQKKTQIMRVFVDRDQMITVLDNLLSNAIKFSPEKGIIQLILSQRRNENIFTIVDQGPGISKSQRRSIFNAFFVGEQANHSILKGTGLGLSIAKQLVEAHSGTLKLLNTKKGAAFRVTLNRS